MLSGLRLPRFASPSSLPVDRAILRGAMQSMSIRVFGVALSYGSTVLLSRLLGVSEYGKYSIALSWVLVLALPAKGGFDISSLRYAMIYRDRGENSTLRGFIITASSVVLAISALIGLIVLVVGRGVAGVDPPLVTWAAILVWPLAMLAVFSSLMRTARRVIESQFYDQMLRPLLIIAGVGSATLAGRTVDAPVALMMTTLAALAALVLLLVHFRFVFSDVWRANSDYAARREWLVVSLPMMLMSVVQELMNHVEVILLGVFGSNREAGLFAASWRLASFVPFVFFALSALAAPLIASANHRADRDEMFRISRLVARIGLLFAIGASAFLFAAGSWLLSLFGPEFVPAVPVLNVLLLGGLVNAFTGVVGYLMILTGRERQALIVFAGALSLSLMLNLLLIPRFGAVGAAIASSAATAAWNLAMLAYVRRNMGIDASALALRPVTVQS